MHLMAIQVFEKILHTQNSSDIRDETKGSDTIKSDVYLPVTEDISDDDW